MAVDPTRNGRADMTEYVTEALASVETEPAPSRLRGKVLEAALAQRPAGRPPRTGSLSPIEAYGRTVDDLGAVLDVLDGLGWAAAVEPYGWTVQGLVGHLLAVERLMAVRLGAGDGTRGEAARLDPPGSDHISMSLDVVAAQDGRDPAATLHDWRAATRAVLDALASSPPDLESRVPFHGVDYRWGTLLVARTLEIWTHTDDIRVATRQPVVAPDEERLSLLTDLAVRTLPLRLATSGRYSGVARVVLTGPGGGAWTQPLSVTGPAAGAPAAGGPVGEGDPEPDVRLVADAVAFCRLAAGRLDPGDLDVTLTGDADLGAAILDSSAAFAV